MKPTERLTEEHNKIKLMLRIMEKVCTKLDAGESVNPEHLEQIVDFIRGFADRWHHGKEEDLLFPAMEDAGVPREGGPIGVMLLEHDSGRSYVKGISGAIARYKAGDRQASSEIAANARNYISLLAQHIPKEDDILYPMADMHLTDEKQEKLLEQFDAVERQTMGIAEYERLVQILDQLSDVYLE